MAKIIGLGGVFKYFSNRLRHRLERRSNGSVLLSINLNAFWLDCVAQAYKDIV